MTGYKFWPTVTKKKEKRIFTVMFRFKHVFLVLFGRKQTRIELNQTLAKKTKLNKNCDEETQK